MKPKTRRIFIIMVSALNWLPVSFFDEYRIERFDSKHSGDEDQYYTIGRVSSILFVVYTERNTNIRIISARPATKEEINEYYEENDIRRS